MRGRLTVGLQILDLHIGVQIPAPQLEVNETNEDPERSRGKNSAPPVTVMPRKARVFLDSCKLFFVHSYHTLVVQRNRTRGDM